MLGQKKFTGLMLVLTCTVALILSACVPLEMAHDEMGESMTENETDDMSMLEVIRAYDTEQSEMPEGIAVDSTGNVYVSLAPLGELRRIASDGTESIVATFDPDGGFGMLGLAIGASDEIYATMVSNNPDIHGVHQISPAGESNRLAGSEAIALPNAIAFDPNGDMFVTDTAEGAVWYIPSGGEAQLWVQDPLMEGNEDYGFGVPVGANGIAYYEGAFYVANTEIGQIVKILINEDGTAGVPELLMADPALVGADGIAFDIEGNLYVVTVSGDTLVQISMIDSEPTLTVLASGEDGFDGPASLAFGTTDGDRQSIYVTNFALFSEDKHPGAVKFDAGIDGMMVIP